MIIRTFAILAQGFDHTDQKSPSRPQPGSSERIMINLVSSNTDTFDHLTMNIRSGIHDLNISWPCIGGSNTIDVDYLNA